MRVAAAAWSVLVFAAVLVGGCASGGNGDGGGTSGGNEFRPAFVDAQQAVIYIFQADETFSGGNVAVVVNQQPMGNLGKGEYRAMVMAPGEYYIRVEGGSSAVARVAVIEGESAFLQVRSGGIPRTTTVQEVSGADGKRLIARTKRVGQ